MSGAKASVFRSAWAERSSIWTYFAIYYIFSDRSAQAERKMQNDDHACAPVYSFPSKALSSVCVVNNLFKFHNQIELAKHELVS